MDHPQRRNSISTVASLTSHCRRCQLDIDADPQNNGRTRILCPFCGDFLLRGSVTNIQLLKQEMERKAREERLALEERSSFRARFSRTFNRMVLRRDSSLNNNGVNSSRQQNKIDGNLIMPPIVNKQKNEKENNLKSQTSLIVTDVATPAMSIYDCQTFTLMIRDENRDDDQIAAFYANFYSNFEYMVQTLSQKDENRSIDWNYVEILHQYVIENADKLSKLILKTIASCCIREALPCDITRKGYTLFLLAPVFGNPTNNHIYAHILRRIAHWNDEEQKATMNILRTLPVSMFRSSVQRLQAFVSVNLFPSRTEDSNSKLINGWWIPSAIRTLALFNIANERDFCSKMSHENFVIDLLDGIDVEFEYELWLKQSKGFNFCQYPFVLSVSAKRTVLKRDSEQQMIFNARRSMIQKFHNKQAPNLNMLFLNLFIRRSHLLADSLAEISSKNEDLKKKLRVTFVGEHGLDMGGLTKEWFLLLLRQIFSPDYGMFHFYESSGVFWFSGASMDNIREFNLVGVLMGLAVYNSIILDIRFPLVCYKKLLSPAYISDTFFNDGRRKIGIIEANLKNFRTVRPDIADGLQYLLDYEGNVVEDFGLTFEVSIGQFDTTVVYPLKENGSKIDVNNDNRKEYVELLIDFYLNKHILKQFEAFYYGFHSVCSSNALLLLLPEELEMLICGMQQCNLSNLAKITKYENCHANEDLIKWFWQLVDEMSEEKQKRLLLFVTGSDRMPIGGLNEMTFKIGKIVSNRSNLNDLLPMSHTCFNQLLLPAYSNREILKEKLLLAIENCEGFGIE